MANIIEGALVGKNANVGVVASRFNDFIVSRLVEGALDCLVRHGVADNDVDVVKVPGAFEIPWAVKKMAESGKYDAIICLGCVIRGATSHYQHIASEVIKGVAQVSTSSGTPISLGVLTVETIEQAIERAGTKSGNKGWSAALSALELINLDKKF